MTWWIWIDYIQNNNFFATFYCFPDLWKGNYQCLFLSLTCFCFGSCAIITSATVNNGCVSPNILCSLGLINASFSFFFMLLAGWNAEEETGAHQESSVCKLHTQIRRSAEKSHQQTIIRYLNWSLSVFQMCARSHHSGHRTADLCGRLPFPDPEASFLPSVPEQQPPSTQNLLWPLQVSKHLHRSGAQMLSVTAGFPLGRKKKKMHFSFLSFTLFQHRSGGEHPWRSGV